MRSRLILSLALAAAMLAVAGCSKKSTGTSGSTTGATTIAGIDLTKTIDAVKAEAAKMDVKQLTAAAEACKEAYLSKQVDLTQLVEKIKDIPLADKMGADAQKLAGQVKTIQEAMTQIQSQLGVYIEKLKELKVDTSALQVK